MPTPLPKYGTSDDRTIDQLEGQQATGEADSNSLDKLLVTFASTALVVDKRNTPPAGVEAEVYRVGASPTGDWSTFDEDDLALFIDAAWYEVDPIDGLEIHQLDTNQTLIYNGAAWVEKQSSVETGITASTTQAQGQQPLTSRVNHVATVAFANDVVTLPEAVAGAEVVVVNRGANTLQVFPASGDDIDDGATNASITQATNTGLRYYAVDGVSWYTV